MKKFNYVVNALILVIAGALLFVFPISSLATAITVLGIAVLVYGVIGLLVALRQPKELRSTPSLVLFALTAILGIWILANPDFVIAVLPIIAGLLIAVNGFESLLRAFALRRAGLPWGVPCILSLISILLGVLIFANPFGTQALLVRVFAFGLIYDGIVGLVTGAKAR
ncbi:MAG: DUF308 domain-containing protein [Oscillospiraceae bacterium]|nr:DUF308 domain-containing protein [Oscillospiraceae bacterium]